MHEIGRRNHNLKLTAKECFEIADEHAAGESCVDNVQSKGKEHKDKKNMNHQKGEPSDTGGRRKRKADNFVAAVDRSRKSGNFNQQSIDRLFDNPRIWHPNSSHKTKGCYSLKGFANRALEVGKDPPRRNKRDNNKMNDDKEPEDGEFQ